MMTNKIIGRRLPAGGAAVRSQLFLPLGRGLTRGFVALTGLGLVAGLTLGCSGPADPPSSPAASTNSTPDAATSPDNSPTSGDQSTPPDAATTGTVKLITHDSFAVPDGLFDQFTAATGLTVEVIPAGNAGAVVNQLILTKDQPLGDVVFGIDNTMATRAVDAGVIAPHTVADLPAAMADLAAPLGPAAGQLTAVDYSDVCINVDHRWFTQNSVTEPKTMADLAKPEYAKLLVVENPATSSPGLAFLLATIAAQGESGWQDYWRDLVKGGVKLVDSWTDAYYVDFSGPSSEGDRPLVVSYASSPPSEVPEGETKAPTGALLETCFRQVEYAGVLAGAANPEGAGQLIDFLTGLAFQNTVAENMWVYPANPKAEIPASWQQYGPLADKPWTLDPAAIAAGRDGWIKDWTELATS